MIRRWLSPIAVRLLLFNVLLVFLPVAGLLSLESLEQQLLDFQERSMVQQGRVVAAALSADTGGVTRDRARALIERLGGRSEARIRIVDRAGAVVADSATLQPQRAGAEESSSNVDPASRQRLLYRIGAALWRPVDAVRELIDRVTGSSPSEAPADVTPAAVVRKALAGDYGATVRESAGQRSLTLYSAVPVRAAESGEVIGAVVVSHSTSRILRALWRIRLDTFEVFVISVVAAILLSLLMSETIARPLIRLRNEADELLDHRGRLRRTFRGSRRRDEIGDLTRALEQLTARLERHIRFVESFSADVSHEFKNPLASIRNGAELLAQTTAESERQQLAATIEKEVARLTRLLNAVREVSRVDAALDLEETTAVDLRSVAAELARALPAAARGRVSLELALESDPVVVTASEERLVQAFQNILDNAISFSPDGARVRISVRAEKGECLFRVDDEGPGIPPEHFEKIFDRFFSFRPDSAKESRDHDGLGLAIARAIVEGYGGRIAASNLEPRGARVEVRLPAAKS